MNKEIFDVQDGKYGNHCIKHSVTGEIKSQELLRDGDNSTMLHCEDKNVKVEESKVRKGFIASNKNSFYVLPRNDIKLDPSPEGDRGPLCREDEKTAEKSAVVNKTEDASEERKSGENPFSSEKAETTGIHSKSNQTAKPHNCPHCPYGCNRERDMEKHLSLHGVKKCRVCPACGYRCVLKIHMTEHENTHATDRPYRCPFCPHASAIKSNMRVHLQTHRCPRCPFTADRGAAVRRHAAAEHPAVGAKRRVTGERLRCDKCPYETCHKSNFTKHALRHRADREEHRCESCPKKYKSKASLEKHAAACVHLGIGQAQVEPFRCGLCAYACASKSQMALHEIKHSRARPYECPQCRAKYKHRKTLIDHQQTIKHSCHLCSFTCCAIPLLAAHMKKHVD